MRKIPVISSDMRLNEFIRAQCESFGSEFVPVFMTGRDEVTAFLKYDLPEIKIVNFSDTSVDSIGLLDEIRKDPWLYYGGIIAIHDNMEDKELQEAMRDQNVIAVIKKRDVERGFLRLLKILRQNKQILFQRGIQQHLIKNIAGSFVIDNDPLDITTYSNLVTNYLFNANLINKDTREKLHVALLELLINAIEHGNCRISYEEKTRWLERNGDIMDLIREKNKAADIRARKVYFTYTITPDWSRFIIRDEGTGFDWRARLAAKRDQPELHGMGMKMAQLYVSKLSYNDSGNEVSFEVEHQRNESNTIPAIFDLSREMTFQDGQYICSEGEESDYLYYIVSGTLYVYSKGKLMSALTPDDMFMGEMSFLLSNRRSATVISKGKSVLIRISKQDFVNLIRDNPHYGIFLARLLAQRLARLNLRMSRLNTEYLKVKGELDELRG
ncbi:MAG TPA: cyclic nucleotide-binding domain-containing protein [Spirochaetales bacterium]|nr:cyclic nucleotide-binding domain-containing protein [Spirochaetales bacterium]MBP7264788.1 cyclic nucleotide-binding domain-containing protein [Spirochaetia bacterium]HPE35901.1 cyclic nucleotide-binding domain-containing protein [Spirochaetales bacterium]